MPMNANQCENTTDFVTRNTNKRTTITHTPFIARNGHLIYCYGDCDRKYEEALATWRESHTGDVMKLIWMDAHK